MTRFFYEKGGKKNTIPNGPGAKDFLALGESWIEASKKDASEAEQRLLDNLYKKFNGEINKACQQLTQKSGELYTSKEYKKRFTTAYLDSCACLRQLVANIVYIKGSDVKSMREKVIDHITENRRPNNTHHYIATEGVYRVSESKNIGKKVIPSSRRSGSTRNFNTNLANFVWRKFGNVNSFGTQFQGITHSSYPPIEIKDKNKRMKVAKRGAEDVIKEFIETQKVLKGNGTKEFPYEIHVSTLMLLTPVGRNLTASAEKRMRKNESENKQLKECMEAIKSSEGKISYKGKIYKIKRSVMNYPVNLDNKKRNLPKNNKEAKINKQGLLEFCDQVANFLQNDVKTNTKEQERIKNILIDTLKKQNYEQLMYFLNNRKDFIKQEVLDKLNTEDEKMQTLRIAFEAMHLYAKYQTRPDPKDAYKFPACYLIAKQRMGDNVEWFCKSGEDRTGRVGEEIETYLAYKDKYGYFPLDTFAAANCKYKQEDVNNILRNVDEFSVHRQITHDNDPGGRGLQISSSMGNNKCLFVSDINCKMGRLPKGITKHLPKPQINLLKQLISNLVPVSVPVTWQKGMVMVNKKCKMAKHRTKDNKPKPHL